MGTSKAQTVGYRYLIGMHMGLCHGPVDELSEIRAGDITVWKGERWGSATYDTILPRWARPKDYTLSLSSTSPVTANDVIRVFAPNAFGGDDREGGIDGGMEVLMGGPGQMPSTYLATVQTGPQPAYRGILSLVFQQGLVSANNPYIKPWAFRLKRIVQGWDGSVWNNTKAAIDVGGGLMGMNPAHMIYEAFTNRKWGHGKASSDLDLTSFESAAQTLYDEGFGLCYVWDRQELIDEFIQRIINHIGGAVGEDPKTGLYRLKLLRADYDIEDLPVFSYEDANLVNVVNFERSTVSDSRNELTVRFNDQNTGKGSSVTVHNLALVKPGGSPSAETLAYPALPTMALATRVALRDLKTSTAGIARATIVCNREAYGLLPGDVFAFRWLEEGIDLMPMRIANIDYGSITDGRITIDCVQDVFGMPLTTYITEQPSEWIEPSREPQPSPNSLVFEMPYRDLVRQFTNDTAAALTSDAAYLASIGQRAPGASFGYELYSRTGSNDYVKVENGEWCPTGTLSGAMTPTTTAVVLNTSKDLGAVGFGQAAFIDDEMLRVDSYDPSTGDVVFARGCGDTVPAAHSAGARVWFYETFEAMDPTEWATAEVVDAKLRTLTSTTILALGSSPGGSVTMDRRANRPYPPGLFRINGLAYPAIVNILTDIVVTWAHRDRLEQQETLVDTLATSIGPEAGTTYTLEIINATTSVVITTVTGITDDNYTITTVSMGPANNIRLKLWAVRAALDSRQMHDWTVLRI